MNKNLFIGVALLCGLTALLSAYGNSGTETKASPEARAKIQQFMGGDSVFIENAGQWPDTSIKFALDSRGANVGLTDRGPRFQLFRTKPEAKPLDPIDQSNPSDPSDQTTPPPPSEMHAFALVFDGAAVVAPVGRGQSERKFNYLVGDTANHREGVGSFDAVWYENLYPGISLEMTGRRSGVKYNFHVAPGADGRVIRLRYEGIDGLDLKEDGALEINIADGWPPLSDGTPYIYQEVNGTKHTVAGKFTLIDSQTYGFEVTGAYDPTMPLVIDPALEWGTYLGGTGTDSGNGIALDGNNDCYVVGTTSSNGWISGGWDTTLNSTDAYVMKLSNDGIPVWSSYIGGTGTDYGNGIALDSNNACYIAGSTNSDGWVSGGWKTTYAGGTSDGYVVKLNSSGGYEWSSYLGGISFDYGNGIAVDTNGACFIVGTTKSSGWVDGDISGTLEHSWGYVVKLNNMGEHIWSKYSSGGLGDDYAYAVAVNSAGDCYVAGSHVWFNYHDINVYRYGIISIIGSDGTKLGSLTGYPQYAYGVAVDSNDIIYAVIEAGDITRVLKSGDTGWIKNIEDTGKTYGRGISLDSQGNCYVTGYTNASGWTAGGWDLNYHGGYDGFVLKMNSAGEQEWSSYLGGTGEDRGYGIAVDSAGATIWIAGSTTSSGWVSGGWQTDYSGDTDAFVLKAIDASIAVGRLSVSLSPPDAITAGAQWRRVGSIFWHNSGDTETHVLPGQHTIEFKTIYGWTSPDVHSVTVTADDTATDMGVYTIIPGSTLQVILTPPEAIAAGAQWRRVGSSTWLNSGDTIYLPMGQHEIEFKPVPYWTAPEVYAISIPIGDTIVDTGNYTLKPIGGLQVTLTPPEAIAAGAQWRRVETSTWLNSGDMENNLFSGQYTIAFKSVYGWITPDLLVVTVEGDSVATATGEYTHTDPNVSWSTYLGGAGTDYGYSIAVDTSGACYATGSTTTSGWVSGGWDTSQNGGMDGYVVKLNVAGEHEWSTYLGGAGDDCGYGIAVDAEGNSYTTGYTNSSGWVSGGWDTILSGTTNPDGYAVKLNTWGGHVWSTYVGAGGSEEGYGIAVDADGNCYATGSTTSTGWVSGGWDTTQNGYIDGYVVKLNSAGMHAWSTYFGGNRDDAGHDITVDATGNCLIAGIYSNNGVFGTFTYGYILKITSAGSYQWSETAGIDRAFTDIVVSGNGDCYVIGRYNALTKLNSAGDILFTGTIKGSGIALDSSDFCYVAGCTNVEGWATGGWDTTLNGLYDGFIAKLTSDGTLLWSSYLGGVKSDYCEDIAVDSSGPNIWVTGHTVSPEWVTDGWQTTYSGFTDAFVVKNVDNIPIEGEGEPVVEGEGEVPAEGEDEVPAEGEGEVSVEGEGETSVEGEGELPIEGEGEGEAKTILLPGDVPLDLVRIPEGSFLMGRYPGEEGSRVNEAPQHEVRLAQGFWMGKYEVTQEQWLAVRNAWPDAAHVPSSNTGLGSTYPAYYISWDDTQDFMASLNAHITDTGQGPLTVRLPSEAEWEYSCRAGTETRFYFGDSLDCAGDCSDCAAGVLPGNRTNYMWYCGNNSIVGAKPVGGKLPNAFGLFDMSGNVNEWCEDEWHDNYIGAPADGSAWVDTPRTTSRVRRGYAWDNNAIDCRSAMRNVNLADYRSFRIGFRLAAVEWMPVEGEGEAPVEGEGEIPVEGEFPVEGEGESVVEGEGEGETPAEGEGEGEVDLVTLTLTVQGSGTTMPTASEHVYEPGSSVYVYAAPETGWFFDRWEGDLEGIVNPFSQGIIFMMDGDRTLTAVFLPGDWLLEIAVTEGGTTSPSPGVHAYLDGSLVWLFADPDLGYAFDFWEGDLASTPQFVPITMDADKSVTAWFAPADWTLSVLHAGSGSGLTFPPDGAVEGFLDGRRTGIVLQGVNPGSYWGGWSGDASGYESLAVVTMDQDRTVVANFSDSGYDLFIDSVGEGVTNLPPGTYALAEDATPVLTATPDMGWLFEEWQGDIGDGDPSSSTLNLLMDRDRSITAVFVESDIEGEGEGEPEGEGEIQPEGEGETPVEGETSIPHPADLNLDYRMVIGEAIAYLAGWQQGANPLAYAIRAAYLWQNGEDYVYDAAQEPPLCWLLPEPAGGEKGGEGRGFKQQ